MTSRRRPLLAVAGGIAVGAFAFASVASLAGERVWEGEWEPPLTDEQQFRGDAMQLDGTVSFFPAGDGDYVSSIAVTADPASGTEGCPSWTTQQTFEPPPSTTTTINTSTTSSSSTSTSVDPSSTPTTSEPPVPRASRDFSYAAAPRCNGQYDVELVAQGMEGDGDPIGATYTMTLDDVVVSLRPPSTRNVTAAATPDRVVTVRWDAPAGYGTAGGGPPPDFVGYLVERANPGANTFSRIGPVQPAQEFVDRSLTSSTGQFRYRVLAVRRGGLTNEFVASDATAAAVATVQVGPTNTTPSTGRPVPAPRPPGAPVVTEQPFDPELDYGGFDPGLDPSLPEDASGLIPVGDDPSGSGLLVPFASALCLAVWAFHLRYLLHRAAEPV